MDCRFDMSGMDLGFLDEEFARRTGVRRVVFRGLRLQESRIGLADLEPFFDGRETVELTGCRNCGCPCRPEDGECPEWATVRCVMSS